jgi:hypothetical protein
MFSGKRKEEKWKKNKIKKLSQVLGSKRKEEK